MCNELTVFVITFIVCYYILFQLSTSSITSSEFRRGVMSQGRTSTPVGVCSEKRVQDLAYGRLYNETTVYLSQENRYAVYMGVRPVLKSDFKRCMRICDGRTGVAIQVNLFQFVRMLSNFKSILWSAEKYAAYRSSDEQYAFTVSEIDVPLVHITRLTGVNCTSFKINLAGDLEKFIIFDEASLHCLIGLERPLIKIYRSLNVQAAQQKYGQFLSKCIGMLRGGGTLSHEVAKERISNEALDERDVFQVETVLKFWDLLFYNIQAELFVQHYASM